MELKDLLTKDLIKQVAKESGEKQTTTKSVLTSALPMLQNLLGGQSSTQEVATQVAAQTKTDQSKILMILTAALPLIKNMLQEKGSDLLSGITGLFSGKDEKEDKKDDKKDDKKEESSAGGILGTLSSLLTGKDK